MYYLSTNTIEQAYQALTSVELNEANIAFSFFIMKACGINKISYELPDFAEKNSLYYASRISALFTPNETHPKKYDFINPFCMREWYAQAASEPLKKWSGGRLKNNIVGGGTQWRGIIDIDTKDNNKIKFKYDYINVIKNMAFDSKKVNLFAFAVWSNRFSAFKQKVTAKELCEEFIKTFKIDIDERDAFFNTQQDFELEFTEEMHDAEQIRNLIGNRTETIWTATDMTDEAVEHIMSEYEFNDSPSEIQAVTKELVKELLVKYNQIILEGPPGTSKSYIANKISEEYDEVIHVQFHPQYSYQNFVGGYVVEKSDVVYKKGVILSLLDKKPEDSDKKYLVIIDELNRANVSQVFGEIIQCLDRNQSVEVWVDGELTTISLPKNIHIIATLNTTDKTLGTIDYAIKRRFADVYCPSEPSVLIDLCPSAGFISLCDFLTKLNANLLRATSSKDLAIGHAVFLSEHVKNSSDNKYYWSYEEFRQLYNYKILPIIEDYCSGNRSLIEDVVGNKLCGQLDSVGFYNAIKTFMEI